MKILLVNGPNLNLLGVREPNIYGATTLSVIESELRELLEKSLGEKSSGELIARQSNHEGEIVNFIQDCLFNPVDFIIINPAAYTHTSIAIRDVLLAVKTPFIEVHLSNIHARESFRQHSYLSDIAVGVICGLGVYGYRVALEYAINFRQRN